MRVLTVFAHPDRHSFCGAVLDRFQEGLKAAGHDSEVADLYTERFNPIFTAYDSAFFADESVPEAVLERMQLRDKVIQSAGGPLRRAIARRWLRDRNVRDIARMVFARRPKDILREQARVQAAEGLAFIAPVYRLGIPRDSQGMGRTRVHERLRVPADTRRLGRQHRRPHSAPPPQEGAAHQHDLLWPGGL